MAKKVTLKDSTTDEIIYPQTLVDSVQDEAGNILPNLVLMKDNAMAFTPTADYQPATKNTSMIPLAVVAFKSFCPQVNHLVSRLGTIGIKL